MGAQNASTARLRTPHRPVQALQELLRRGAPGHTLPMESATIW
ncbi:hypothetical protein MMMB2_2331 [Mycobacterium marinum MB2]|nr:hypothetical protein MMMB2_2331 [Mycobacterium marinum MB2]